jgi:hypothetical protein
MLTVELSITNFPSVSNISVPRGRPQNKFVKVNLILAVQNGHVALRRVRHYFRNYKYKVGHLSALST